MASSSKVVNETQSSILAQKYQKKTDKEHVLDTPDTYTGSMTVTDYDTFVFVDNADNADKSNGKDKDKDGETNDKLSVSNDKIVEKQVSIVPGLYKIFDEAVVNTRDQTVRMRNLIDKGNTDAIPVTEIDISFDKQEGTITLSNNGNGIDIAKHPAENIWIPELIFAHLRTSTNYDKKRKKQQEEKMGLVFKLRLFGLLGLVLKQ
jgi:DNA topoisomerase-2